MMEQLSGLMERIEKQEFQSPLLRQLRADLTSGSRPPSVLIRRLRMILEWLNLQGSMFFAPIARILQWSAQCALSIEAWRRTHGAHLRTWLRVTGEFEALMSLASYSYEHPADPFPAIAPEGARFEAVGLGHPLLSETVHVRNDIALGPAARLFVISGSNMSGKSTLLRTIGINTVLALAGGVVRATELTVSPLQIGASLRTQDSLQGGISRFYAEILRLRQVVAMTDSDRPLLFLLDEILHGTNSHDRLIGAEAIVRTLVAHGAIGLITTHDLALARIESDPSLLAVNVHFEDQLVDGKMSFDYKLRPGVVAKSNALELMRAVGLDV
jgi:DNA mismatch repair ATPase MutS